MLVGILEAVLDWSEGFSALGPNEGIILGWTEIICVTVGRDVGEKGKSVVWAPVGKIDGSFEIRNEGAGVGSADLGDKEGVLFGCSLGINVGVEVGWEVKKGISVGGIVKKILGRELG